MNSLLEQPEFDPNPDLHTLFLTFNDWYFSSVLLGVEVRWSSRMTSCAGTCSYYPGGYCSIRLSEPLLKFRPQSDYINTLLHEMIHAYLFLTKNNRDREGHGPEFLEMARLINDRAGTNITVYHTFIDEVRHYQTHIWQCDGPCKSRPPYFGIVRRSMNRPPQPADNWWKQHLASCGGVYTKISEPVKPERKKKAVAGAKKENNSKHGCIDGFLIPGKVLGMMPAERAGLKSPHNPPIKEEVKVEIIDLTSD